MVAADFPEFLRWNTALTQDRYRLFHIFGPDRNDDARLGFVKECSGSRAGRVIQVSRARHGRLYTTKINLCAEALFRIETGFRQRNRESAFAAIVRALHQTGVD